ncbi:DUF452 family protein [bacterium]|nr:DUF452 family protein [bacterium]
METLLRKNNSNELIVFFNGWGCDNNSCEAIKSTKDVLICWDYSSLDFNFKFSGYKKYYLIAYSAGVFVAGVIKDKLPNFDYKIAINGNPMIFDEKYGISKNIVKIFRGLNLDNYMDFRLNYLVRNREELAYFNAHQPNRTFESCFYELDKLEEYSKEQYKIIDYDLAILGAKDKVFNHEAQKEYYFDKYKVLENYAHDVFFYFRNFDDILNFAKM